ncbi:proton-coupled amino acid transporter-like protein CG1139 isoform X2 [Drosophila kikkawai]
MPRAFLDAGWLTGLIMTIVLGFFMVYTMHVVLNDINSMQKRFGVPLLSYGKSMEVAVSMGPRRFQFLAKPMHYYVDILVSLYHFGVDSIYVVFIAKILKDLGDIYFWPLDERLYMALLLPPLILTFFIRQLKLLKPFSLISNLMITIAFLITLSYLLQDLPEFSELRPFQPLKSLPLVFGTLLFSIESIGVILTILRRMQTPADFLGTCGVLNRGMAVVILFYAGFGVLGYWRYGQHTASSVLHNLPMDEILTQLVAGFFALGVFFSYALSGYVTVDIIWHGYMEQKMEAGHSSKMVKCLVQIALVIASVLVAILFPDFWLLLSIVGSFCMAQLGLIFPGILDLCVQYEEGYGPGRILLWRSMIFIAGGLAGGVAGTLHCSGFDEQP